MRVKYFSWLSHDDVYLLEKIQVEIETLRKAGDMSRVVYSNWLLLTMPERIQTMENNNNDYRQGFLKTGALASLLGFISGCSLLIPKFYFDVYGCFDEIFRVIQDYKKRFEMFRGKRLVYVHQPLILSRKHSEQITKIYRLTNIFGKWCHPNYNSAVATFCFNVARNLPLQINDLQSCRHTAKKISTTKKFPVTHEFNQHARRKISTADNLFNSSAQSEIH